MRRILAKMSLLVVATTATFLVAEVAARVAYAGVTTTADNASYFARRWYRAHPIQRNSLGFREREIARKAPNTMRIVVLGDSFTFGQGIAREDRLTERLAGLLASHEQGGAGQDGMRYEVLNFGTPGAETIDHIETLRGEVLAVSPDLILLQWYVNDVEGHDKTGRPQYARLIPSDRITSILRRRSALFYLVERGWRRMQISLGMTHTYEEYVETRFGDEGGEPWRRARAELEDLIAIARDHSIPIGIVGFPPLGDIDGGASRLPAGFLMDRLFTLCEEEGIPCLDLRPVFATQEVTSLTVNLFDDHPGPQANELAAAAVYKQFSPWWNLLTLTNGENRP